jgi:signal transduction histidine kinase
MASLPGASLSIPVSNNQSTTLNLQRSAAGRVTPPDALAEEFPDPCRAATDELGPFPYIGDLAAELRNAVLEQVGCDSAAVCAWDAKADVLWMIHPLPEQRVRAGQGVGSDQGLVGQVFRTGLPAAVTDYQRWPGRLGDWRADGVGALAGVPITVDGRRFGVLVAAHRTARDWSEGTLKLLTDLATSYGARLELARLHQLAARRSLVSRAFADLARDAATHGDFELMMDRLSATMGPLLKTGCVEIILARGSDLVISHARLYKDAHPGIPVIVPLAGSATEVALETGRLLVASRDPLPGELDLNQFRVLTARGASTAVVVPFVQTGLIRGALAAIWDTPQSLPPWRLRMCRTLADQLGALLTVLESRRTLTEKEAELRAIIEQLPSGVAVVDRHGYVRRSNSALRAIVGPPVHPELPLAEQAADYRLRCVENGRLASAERTPVARALQGDTVLEEWELQRPDTGKSVHLQFSSSPLRAPDGEVTGAVSVITDITPRRESERRRRRLAGQILQAQEEERHRVAAEVHDELIQTMIAICQHLDAHAAWRDRAPEVAEAELQQGVLLARQAVREGRRIMAGLRPSLLDELGLEPALLEEADALRAGGWRVRVSLSLPSERHDPSLETAVFRLVQEALRNVRKHAGLCAVNIRIDESEGQMHVEIHDDGCGFTPDTTPHRGRDGGLGLVGMRERAALLGGTLEIQSEPGHGTRVSATLPLEPRRAGS